MSLGLVVSITSFVVLTHNTNKESRKKNKGFCGLYKIKDFYCVKNLIQKIKRQHTLGEKTLQTYLIKNLSQNRQRTTTQPH